MDVVYHYERFFHVSWSSLDVSLITWRFSTTLIVRPADLPQHSSLPSLVPRCRIMTRVSSRCWQS